MSPAMMDSCPHWECEHLVCMECGMAFESREEWRAAQQEAERDA